MKQKLTLVLAVLSALVALLLMAGVQPWPLIIAYWLVLTMKNAGEAAKGKDDV